MNYYKVTPQVGILLFTVLVSLVWLSSFDISLAFAIDTENPTVISKTVSDTLISDSDDSGTFDIVVTFSETMDTGISPTIVFTPDVSSTLSFSSGAWSSGDTVYTATYDVADAGVAQTDIAFTVSDAEDLANNLQDTDVTDGDIFAIDTENPTISIVYLDNDNFTTDLYSKSGTIVTLTATASEALVSSPDITITGANSVGPSAMTTVSDTLYTFEHITGIGDGTATVSVDTATDVAGNLIVTIPTNGANFYVDNTSPIGTITIQRTDSTGSDSSVERTYLRNVNLILACSSDPASPDTSPGSGCENVVDISGTGLVGEDAVTFESMSSPRAATLTEFRDLKTASATYRDNVGNTALFSDNISLDAKIVDITVNDNTPYWGADVTFNGSVKNARTDDTITFTFGSPTITGIVIAGGDASFFNVTDSYPKISLDSPNPHQSSAILVDSSSAPVVDSNLLPVNLNGPIVNVQPHPTSVLLDFIPDPFGGDVFTATGDLIDDLNLSGIAGKTVEFDGTGAVPSLADATTGGFTVTDSTGIIIDNVSSDYILRAGTGLKIDFDSNPVYVSLALRDMGFNSVDLLVTPTVGTPFTTTGEGQGANIGLFRITHPSGISSIEITNVSSGLAGITNISTLNNDQVQIIDVEFDNVESGLSSSLSYEEGAFASQGTSITTPTVDLIVNAHFDSDADYEASVNEVPNTDTQTYSVQYATAGGYGGTTAVTPDSGTGITSILCAADADGDALCDDWEGIGKGVPISGGGLYNLPDSDPNKKDIYVEIDYMDGHDPFVSGAINDVIGTFAKAPVTNVSPATNGIVLHVEKGEKLTHTANLGVWTEFNALKAANFGTPSQTTAQKTARAQAYHYFISAHSIGGASGVAELSGNDGILSLGQGFGETNATHAGTEGTKNEIAGTFMHELGHQLGLNHGGPSTSTFKDNNYNCKPNHDSIMSYSRQLPNILGANWVLDYSNGGLGPLTGLKESGGTGGNILEKNGNLVSLDNALTPGTDPLPWIIWGTPGISPGYKMQQARVSAGSPADIDWDGNSVIDQSTTPLSRDINGLGFFGCEVSATKSTEPFKNPNEWTNLNYNFRGTVAGSGFDGVETTNPQDADSQINLQTRIASAYHQEVSPWNTDSSITRKANTNVPIKIQLFDGQNLPIIGGETTVTYTMYKSGSSTVVSQGNLDYEPGTAATSHWHTDVKVPKTKGTYYITIGLSNGVLPATITKDPNNNPQYVNLSQLMSMKLISN